MSIKTYQCSVCAAPVEMQECHRKRIKHTFCSDKCRDTPFIQKHCHVCQSPFLVTYHNAHDAKFCSDECCRIHQNQREKNGYQPPRITIKCKQCCKEFSIKRSLLRKQEYCSQKCSGVAHGQKYKGVNSPVWKPKIKISCDYCGREFEVHPCRHGKRKYCCNEHRLLGNMQRFASGHRTDIEVKMAQLLDNHKIKFTEQYIMFNKFMVDFLLTDYPIVVQCDGAYWHEHPKAKARDKGQDRYLSQSGYIVLRFSDKQIMFHDDNCIKIIKKTIKTGQMPLINW